MKTILLSLSIFCVLLLSSCTSSQQPKEQPRSKADAGEFLGQWTLDIAGGWVGWLEVRQSESNLTGDLLWKWGSVTPVDTMFIASGNYLVAARGNNVMYSFTPEGKAEKHRVSNEWVEVIRDGDKIAGKMISPRPDGKGVDTVAFTGVKLPTVPSAPDLTKVKYGKPEVLFNGKDLTGWKLIDEKLKNGFSVAKGILITDPAQKEGEPYIEYGNLRTIKEYEDFNLKIEVNVPQGSNSGVYLRGMYEIQVLDSYKKPLDSHNMGAVYSRVRPTVNAEKPAGEWQSLDITLCDRHVTVILNGTKIIDNQPVFGPTGGALKSDVFAPGPIFLQGDHGKVSFRNIVLTPIVK